MSRNVNFPFSILCISAAAAIALSVAVSALAADIPRHVGKSIACRVASPTGVAVDGSGNSYVTESSANRLVVYDRSGSYLRELKGLGKPTGVAVDPWGRVYVSNTGAKTVDVYDANLARLFSLGGGGPSLVYPTSVAVDSTGRAYVADSKDNRVKVYDSGGSFLFSFGGRGSQDGNLNFPVSVAINEIAGEVIVSDLMPSSEGYRGAGVHVFDRNGTFKRRFGGYGEGQGFFIRPMGLAVDGSGRIYVADSFQNVIQVFDSGGNFIIGLFDNMHPVRTPMGIAYCRSTERLYVASLNTSKVEVFGNSPQDGSGGGQTVPMSFFSSGGGGCSIAGDRRGGVDHAWPLLPVLAALALRLFRKKRTEARASR